MKKQIILAAAFAAFSTAAFAADMPLKAPPITPGYPTKCGVYFGLNTEGVSGPVNGAAPGTIMLGGDIGGTIGYACNFSGVPWFVEGIFDFQNLNGTANGFNMTGPAHLEQRVGVQAPFMQFLPTLGFPSFGTPPNLPVLPPGVTVAGTPAWYVYGAANEDDISASVGLASARAWLFSPEAGVGLLTPVKVPVGSGYWNAVIDTWAGAEFESQSISVGAMNPKLATRFKAGLSVKF